MSVKFRKRPVSVEAVQWRDRTIVCPPGPLWFSQAERRRDIELSGDRLHVKTAGGIMVAKPGDWIVSACGRIWVVECEVFELLYDSVPEPSVPACPTCGCAMVRTEGKDYHCQIYHGPPPT